MGVHGVVSNDPRLFAEAERIAAGGAPASEPDPEGAEGKSKRAEKKPTGAEKD
jgi:hypothetical protein